MLVFPCPGCGALLQVQEQWAGKKVQCGRCRTIVEAPVATAAGAAPPPVPRPAPLTAAAIKAADSGARPPTPAPPPKPAERELYDFLGPARAPGELGRLGGYRVLAVLGSGGMGVVFRAEDVQLRRPVALKALLPAQAADGGARQRFLREARAMAAVRHDHVVTIHQVSEERSIPFLAMELLEGETLEARLQREPRLPVADVVRIGREAAEGLAAAHERGLVHRDVKPANLWLEAPRGRVKILDFGLARAAADDHLTQSGALVGTPGYLAPEQAQGAETEPRSDLFSLGCVLYRCCAGRPPFQGADTLALLAALATEVPRPVQELNPAVPPALGQLVMSLLARSPAARPASARAVALGLAALEADRPAATPAPPELPRAVPAAATPAVPLAGPIPTAVLADGAAAVAAKFQTSAPRRTVHPGCLVGLVVAGVGAVVMLLLLVTGAVLLARNLGGRPPATAQEVTAPPELFPLIQAGVRQHDYTETKPVGGAFARMPFEEVPPEGAVLIGFEVGTGHDVEYLRPIFLTAQGEKLGTAYGKPSPHPFTVKAKPGYAVGGMTVRGGGMLDGFSMTFMQMGKRGLKRAGSYQSEWIGGHGGGEGTMGGDGALVIGICGLKTDDGRPGALGAVLLRPETD